VGARGIPAPSDGPSGSASSLA